MCESMCVSAAHVTSHVTEKHLQKSMLFFCKCMRVCEHGNFVAKKCVSASACQSSEASFNSFQGLNTCQPIKTQ